MRWLMKKWCELWIRDTKDHAIKCFVLGTKLASVSVTLLEASGYGTEYSVIIPFEMEIPLY